MSKKIQLLNKALIAIPSGPIHASGQVEQLLMDAWDDFSGSTGGGMAAEKISGRTYDLDWDLPVLSFKIERHGGIVQGSSHAEIQHWSVNLRDKTATLSGFGYKQLKPRSPALDLAPIISTLTEVISQGTPHKWIQWNTPNRFRLLIGKIIPDNGSSQTIQSRRRQLNKSLEQSLSPSGWRLVRANLFER